MNPLIKFVLVATAAVTFLLLGAGALLAYGLFHGGVVHVQIHDRSPHSNVDLDLPVPAGLLVGLSYVAEMANAADEADEAGRGSAFSGRHRLRLHRLHAWRPAARAACEALAAGPDGLLLDVANGEETVRIRKQSDTLDIHVEGPGTDVHVTAPAGLLRHLANVV
jgi:hypothetical protein